MLKSVISKFNSVELYLEHSVLFFPSKIRMFEQFDI